MRSQRRFGLRTWRSKFICHGDHKSSVVSHWPEYNLSLSLFLILIRIGYILYMINMHQPRQFFDEYQPRQLLPFMDAYTHTHIYMNIYVYITCTYSCNYSARVAASHPWSRNHQGPEKRDCNLDFGEASLVVICQFLMPFLFGPKQLHGYIPTVWEVTCRKHTTNTTLRLKSLTMYWL